MERMKYYGNGYANKNQEEILKYINHIDLESNMTLEDIIEVFNIRQMIESNSWMMRLIHLIFLIRKPLLFLGKFYSKYQLDSDAINDYNSLDCLHRCRLARFTRIPIRVLENYLHPLL
ncbi:hypothetical protein [Enterococcus sp. AZ196]|uniref:hypothetical protein n=1 Tax=Enterococcus sp. AZ196 TaxID=2774659 RepID=UPI003D2CAFCC